LEARACRNQARKLVLDGPRFSFRKQSKFDLCREIDGVVLAMMKDDNSTNNDSIREIMVKLVCIESNSHLDEGC
jgi:hypothetical protein